MEQGGIRKRHEVKERKEKISQRAQRASLSPLEQQVVLLFGSVLGDAIQGPLRDEQNDHVGCLKSLLEALLPILAIAAACTRDRERTKKGVVSSSGERTQPINATAGSRSGTQVRNRASAVAKKKRGGSLEALPVPEHGQLAPSRAICPIERTPERLHSPIGGGIFIAADQTERTREREGQETTQVRAIQAQGGAHRGI